MLFKNIFPGGAGIDPLNLALGGMPGGEAGLAGIGGAGGMSTIGSDSIPWDQYTGTGFQIVDDGIDETGLGLQQPGDTPIDLPDVYDPGQDTPYDTPYDIPWHGDPYPDDTPTYLPPLYDPPPPPTPTSPPTDIDTGSITPPASPGQIPPQFSMPNFAYNFPMPNINPLMGGPNMGPVGFYSVNSGAAGLPVPAYGGIENPNMLSNYVQQFVGGPDVLTRSLLG